MLITSENGQSLEELFRSNNPCLVLSDYQSNDALLDLIDCDDYLVGSIALLSCTAICIHLEGVAYDDARVLSGRDRDDLRRLGIAFELPGPDWWLVSMQPEEPDETMLPAPEGDPLAYIVCRELRLGPPEQIWPHPLDPERRRRFR